MKYLLINDGSYYHNWQTELCIESFKNHDLEENLFVYFGKLKSSEYTKNLNSIKNKVCYESSGNYFYDKLFILKEFAKNNSSICLIHPDMILQKPVKFYNENIVTSYDPGILDFPKEMISDQLKDIIKKTDAAPKLPPIGNVFIFNNMPEMFYNSLLYNYNKIKDNNIKEKGCFLISIMQSYYGYFDKRYSLKIDSLEQTLLHDNIFNNFIHYKNGISPNWSKHFYKSSNFSLNEFSNPFEKLNDYNLNSSVNYILKIISSYLIRK